MTESATAEGKGAKRLVLGFDAGCGTCSDSAQRIQERVGEKLAVRNLRDPEVEGWREEALGKAAPWAPTLFEVEGGKVRAWVGVRMGLALSRRLGPKDTWRVMQLLGEIGAAPGIEAAVEESTVVGKLPERAQEAMAGISRGQFLKGVGGAAVAMSLLSSGAVFPSVAQAATNPATSTGTPTQQRLAKSIVRNSRQFKAIAAQQSRIGATFEFSRAIVKVVRNKFAAVAVGSGNHRRIVTATFFVDLRDKSVVTFKTRTTVPTIPNEEVLVTSYINASPLRPYHKLRVGRDYVVLEDGRRMSPQQFRDLASRSQPRVTQGRQCHGTAGCEECYNDASAACNLGGGSHCAIEATYVGLINPVAGGAVGLVCVPVIYYGCPQIEHFFCGDRPEEGAAPVFAPC